MGRRLEEIIDKHSLEWHNSGEATYCSGTTTSAIDVTLSRGLEEFRMSWKVVDEDVSSPHSPILLRVGSKANLPPRQAIDWKNFDWSLYESKTAAFLGNLIEIWESNCEQEAERSPNEMVSELHRIAQLIRRWPSDTEIAGSSRPSISLLRNSAFPSQSSVVEYLPSRSAG